MSEVKPGTPSTDRGHKSHRLSAIVRHLVRLADAGQEHELIDAVVQAAAIWYDMDARAYKRDLHGRFVLDTWLPGADLTSVPRDFSAFAVVAGPEVIRISSIAEQERLWWECLVGDLMMLPITAGAQSQPRWVVVISDWRDSHVDPDLLMLCQILGALLKEIAVRQVKEAQQRLLRRLVQSDESWEHLATVALKELVDVVDAAQGRLVVRLAEEIVPRTWASVGGEWTETPLPLKPGQSVASARRITVALALGQEVAAVVDMRPRDGVEFSFSQVLLGEAGAMVFGVWLAGTLKGATPVGQVTTPVPSAEMQIGENVRSA